MKSLTVSDIVANPAQHDTHINEAVICRAVGAVGILLVPDAFLSVEIDSASGVPEYLVRFHPNLTHERVAQAQRGGVLEAFLEEWDGSLIRLKLDVGELPALAPFDYAAFMASLGSAFQTIQDVICGRTPVESLTNVH